MLQSMLKGILDFLGTLLLHGLASLGWAIGVLVQFLVCCYLSYLWIYVPAAAAPGSRDGTGLLLVMGFCFLCAAVVTAILGAIEADLIKRWLPDWEPPGTDEY